MDVDVDVDMDMDMDMDADTLVEEHLEEAEDSPEGCAIDFPETNPLEIAELADEEGVGTLNVSEAEAFIDASVLRALADKFNGSIDCIRPISKEDHLF